MTHREAARILGVSRERVRQLMHAGHLQRGKDEPGTRNQRMTVTAQSVYRLQQRRTGNGVVLLRIPESLADRLEARGIDTTAAIAQFARYAIELALDEES